MGGSTVQVRRAYDEPRENDGTRVLVDRIWPRGLSKDKAHFDEWCKAVAPSTELRKWYSHDPDKFDEFKRRYRDELLGGEQSEAVDHLRNLASKGTLTLVTASKAADISQAAVLQQILG